MSCFLVNHEHITGTGIWCQEWIHYRSNFLRITLTRLTPMLLQHYLHTATHVKCKKKNKMSAPFLEVSKKMKCAHTPTCT